MFLPGSVLNFGEKRNHIICQKVIACEIVTEHVPVCVHMIGERMESESDIVDLTAVKTEVSTGNHPNMVIHISCY